MPALHGSVLQVTKDDYETCDKSKSIQQYKGGNTKVELKHSGPFYFISGANGNCEKGEKLIIVVVSSEHKPIIAVTPAPAPVKNVMEIQSPAPAQAKGDGYGLKGGVGGVMLGCSILLAIM